MNLLAFSGRGFEQLRGELLAGAPDESAALLLARSGRGATGQRFVVEAILLPDPPDYLERGRHRASLSPAFVARALQRARREDLSIFLVHTHPFQDGPEFSAVDDAGERMIAPALHGRVHGREHGSLVIGRTGFAARLFDSTGSPLAAIDRIAEAGPALRFHDAGEDPQLDADLYDRNIRAFGRPGQAVLARLRVGIVGLGGTGCFAAEELARLGVGSLLLVDNEVIENSNLNRVIGASRNDLGRAKVEVARRAILRANSGCVVTPLQGNVVLESVGRHLIDCDFVMCCTDSHGSRAVINQIAYQYLVPCIDVGVRIDAADERVTAAGYRVQMIAPGLSCLVCHPLLNPEAIRRDLMSEPARSADPYVVGFHEPQPAVVSLNGTATSSAVTMFLAAVTGLPGSARHLIGRPLDGIVRPIVAERRAGCVVCADENAAGKADAWPMPWIRSR
jgi:hypothetical protein